MAGSYAYHNFIQVQFCILICLLIINWFRQEWWTLTCDDEQLLSSAFRYCMDYKIIISHRRCKNFLFVCLGYWYSSAVKGKQKTNKQKNRQRNNQTTNCHISDMLPHRPRKELRHSYLLKGTGYILPLSLSPLLLLLSLKRPKAVSPHCQPCRYETKQQLHI